MGLPDDASIADVAKELGVSDEKYSLLSDRCKELTKGDVVALLGVSDDQDARTAFALTIGGQLAPKPVLTDRNGELTILDRASLGKAFGSVQEDMISATIRTNEQTVTDELMISCCSCCPCTCCCAAAVAKPARIA